MSITPKLVTCANCNGTGMEKVGLTKYRCKVCKGSGKVFEY
jgi:DnaJ-class molecular chaperone